MFTIEEARELLRKAEVFYYNDPSEITNKNENILQVINFNDIWAWASAWGEYVPDNELPIVAELFWLYGWCGILYWCSEKHDKMKSEFHDINRMIEFVRKEEAIKKDIPDPSKRAYTKKTYKLGAS